MTIVNWIITYVTVKYYLWFSGNASLLLKRISLQNIENSILYIYIKYIYRNHCNIFYFFEVKHLK